MKGISFIIIMSIVWSIISAIIEKREKAKKQLLKDHNQNREVGLKTKPLVRSQPKSAPVISFDPELVRVEALRRKRAHRKASQAKRPEPVVEPVKKATKKKIIKLHEEACELQPTTISKPKKPILGQQIALMLKNRRNLRTAVVLSEILQKPISIR